MAGVPDSAASQVAFAQDLNRELTSVLDGFAEHEGFSGVVLVAIGDSIVLHQARGTASLELGVPLRTDHRILLASVAKSFTAAAILRLVDSGHIDLAAPASDYLPDAGIDPRITIHHLLTHTSGLARDLLPGTERTRREHFSTRERVSIAVGHGLRFQPGSQYAYSSPGYVVLAAIIEQVTGEPLQTALERLVFEPLEMTSTGLEIDAALIPDRASRYQRLMLEPAPAVYEDPTFGYGSGSVSGTAADLLKFSRALLDDGFLSRESRVAMVSDQIAGQGYGVRPYRYSVGPRIGGDGGTGFGYEGGTAGVAASFNVLMDHRAVVIVLSNVTPFATNRLSNPLLNMALGHEPPGEIAWRDDSGFYRVLEADGMAAAVAWAEATDGQGDRHLVPLPGDLFQEGYGLYLHHRLDEAETILRSLIALAPSSTAFVVLGRVLLERGDREGACDAFGEAVIRSPAAAGTVPPVCGD